jgi:hypothetical protein
MSPAPQLDPLADTKRLDVAADQAIAACDGDMRAAIRALIMVNEYLEMELSEVYAVVSRGYTRSQVWREPSKADESEASEIDLDNIPDWWD